MEVHQNYPADSRGFGEQYLFICRIFNLNISQNFAEKEEGDVFLQLIGFWEEHRGTRMMLYG